MKDDNFSEEVTITPVIRDIERLFIKFFRFVTGIFTWLLNQLATFFRFLFRHILVVTLFVILGGTLGFYSIKFFPRTYESELVLELNIDTKEQLKNDVNYFNNLMKSKSYGKIQELLGVSKEVAKSLTDCKTKQFSSEVEKAKELNNLSKNMDTTVFRLLNKETFLEPNDDQLSNKFLVKFSATEKTVFQGLEEPFLNYLRKSDELNIKLENDKRQILFQKSAIKNEIEALNKLQLVMNEAIIASSKKESDGGNTYFSLGEGQQNDAKIDPIEIQSTKLFLASWLVELENDLVKLEKPYFIVAHLNPLGTSVGSGGFGRVLWGMILSMLIGAGIVHLFSQRKK